MLGDLGDKPLGEITTADIDALMKPHQPTAADIDRFVDRVDRATAKRAAAGDSMAVDDLLDMRLALTQAKRRRRTTPS